MYIKYVYRFLYKRDVLSLNYLIVMGYILFWFTYMKLDKETDTPSLVIPKRNLYRWCKMFEIEKNDSPIVNVFGDNIYEHFHIWFVTVVPLICRHTSLIVRRNFNFEVSGMLSLYVYHHYRSYTVVITTWLNFTFAGFHIVCRWWRRTYLLSRRPNVTPSF